MRSLSLTADTVSPPPKVTVTGCSFVPSMIALVCLVMSLTASDAPTPTRVPNPIAPAIASRSVTSEAATRPLPVASTPVRRSRASVVALRTSTDTDPATPSPLLFAIAPAAPTVAVMMRPARVASIVTARALIGVPSTSARVSAVTTLTLKLPARPRLCSARSFLTKT
jgi:hypothetical protein